MAVDFCTDSSSSRGMSPRISFSHDLNQCDIVPIESTIPLKPPSLLDYDFDFCVSRRSCEQDSSLADELFANGVILPIQIKRKNLPPKSKSFPSLPLTSQLPSPVSVSVLNETETNSKETEEKQGKSFWTFKRSKSLNCGSIYRRGLCPLPLLSRSKSTGSNASAKRALISKDEGGSHSNLKQSNLKNMNSSSSSNHQKPPLRKNYGSSSSFNSGLVQVNPVLNMPTGKLLGFGSIFSNGKDKGRKK